MSGVLGVALLVLSNAITATICLLLSRRRHRHDWSDWSEWTEDVVNHVFGNVRAVRYRTCESCSAVRSQDAGDHRCREVYNRKPCPHLTGLIGNEAARIKRLERELGL